MQKTALFVPDLSPNVGMGHFFRCLRCAMYLKSVGWSCTLIAPDLNASTRTILRQEKIAFIATKSLSAGEVSRAIKAESSGQTWIVTDHYKLAAKWEKQIRALTMAKLAVFDDDDGRKHSCEIIIRTNELLDTSNPKTQTGNNTSTRILAGPRYFIPDATMLRYKRKPAASLKSILFFLGGASDNNKFLEILDTTAAAVESTKIKINAIAPLNFKHNLPTHLRNRVKLIKNYSLLGKLLAKTDLFVGSGGTITFDRLLFNVPGIVFSLAANQDKLSVALAKRGANIFLGPIGTLTKARLTHAIQSVVRRSKLYRDLCVRSGSIVDGRGGHRLNMHLLHFPIVLRAARSTDEKRILIWRNTPQVRAASINTDKISANKHHLWFQQKIRDKGCALLIAESSHGAVAVLRFDLNPKKSSATVSIFLTPAVMGSGLGSEVLKAGTEWLRKKHRQIAKINAVIRPDNIASIRSFLAAGYRQVGKYYVKKLHM